MTNRIEENHTEAEISRFLPDAAPLPMPEQVIERAGFVSRIVSALVPPLQSIPGLRSLRS